MLPILREGVDPAYAAKLLLDAGAAAGNVMGAGSPLVDRFNAYQEWAVNAERLLASVLTPAELARLLQTQRYWALHTGTVTWNGALATQLTVELVGRQDELKAAGEAIKSELGKWAYSGNGFPARRRHALVLDTNVLEMLGASLGDFPWSQRASLSEGAVTLVIPSVVREELDKHKLSDNRPRINGVQFELRKQARDALRVIGALFPGRDDRARLESATVHPIDVYLPVDELTRVRFPIADNEIVADALELLPYAESVTLVSYDTNISLTAARYGLQTLRLRYED